MHRGQQFRILVSMVALGVACQDSTNHLLETNLHSFKQKKEEFSGMCWIPGGVFLMGSTSSLALPEEGPVHEVTLKGFWMDETEVTNAQFAQFVKETGYVTSAERGMDKEKFSHFPPEMLKPGALVFSQAQQEIDPMATSMNAWWRFLPEACWRHPLGPDSSITGKEHHPVVCITYEDAHAYAQWAGKRLPTEAEWEFAARGGLVQKDFVWGDEMKPQGNWLANVWQGKFPSQNEVDDGFYFTAPVKSYPPNNYGLYDMAGNVWEICADYFQPDYYHHSPPQNPQGPDWGIDPDQYGIGRRVIRGGSFLCAEGYCFRFRPSARQSTPALDAANHTGFRCVKDAP